MSAIVCSMVTDMPAFPVTVPLSVRCREIIGTSDQLQPDGCKLSVSLTFHILVMWLECRFLDTEVDGSNPGISMLSP